MLTGDGPVPVPAARTERTADGRPRASRYRLSLSPMQLHRSHVGAHKARVVCVSSNSTHITLSHTRGDGRSLRDGFNVISARAGVGGCPPEPFRSGVALHTVAASKRPPYLLNSTSGRRPPFLGGGGSAAPSRRDWQQRPPVRHSDGAGARREGPMGLRAPEREDSRNKRSS